MSTPPSTPAIQLSNPRVVVPIENRLRSLSPPPTTVTYSANDECLPFDHARFSSPQPPAMTDSAGDWPEFDVRHEGDSREDLGDQVPSSFEADKPPPKKRARDRYPSQESTRNSNMETYLRTISAGTSHNPESSQYCSFGDEWAVVGRFTDLQDLTYDEDLSLSSDVVMSIPKTASDPSSSCTTADSTNEGKPVEQNGNSQGKRNSLPYSDEYFDVYLDV